MDDHYMCPVQAWDHYCTMYPAYTRDPLNPLLADPNAPSGTSHSFTNAYPPGHVMPYGTPHSLQVHPPQLQAKGGGSIPLQPRHTHPRHPTSRFVGQLRGRTVPQGKFPILFTSGKVLPGSSVTAHKTEPKASVSLEEHFSCNSISPTEHFQGTAPGLYMGQVALEIHTPLWP